MKYLENVLLIPFNIKDKNGMWFDEDSFYWETLNEKTLFGVIGEDFEVGATSLSKASHQIINFQIKNSGVYGDIRILNSSEGDKLKAFDDNNIDIVFRNSGAIDYNATNGYCKALDIWGFNMMLKSDDIYDEIVWRSGKLNKILSNIN